MAPTARRSPLGSVSEIFHGHWALLAVTSWTKSPQYSGRRLSLSRRTQCLHCPHPGQRDPTHSPPGRDQQPNSRAKYSCVSHWGTEPTKGKVTGWRRVSRAGPGADARWWRLDGSRNGLEGHQGTAGALHQAPGYVQAAQGYWASIAPDPWKSPLCKSACQKWERRLLPHGSVGSPVMQPAAEGETLSAPSCHIPKMALGVREKGR